MEISADDLNVLSKRLGGLPVLVRWSNCGLIFRIEEQRDGEKREINYEVTHDTMMNVPKKIIGDRITNRLMAIVNKQPGAVSNGDLKGE